MADQILHKRSLTSGNVPTTSSLSAGEIAINVPDGKIYILKSGSAGQSIESAITSNSTSSIGTLLLSGSLILSGSTEVNSGSVLDVSADNISFDFDSLAFSGSAEITGSLIVTGGISGSFSGSGANLSNIPASAIVGLNLSQIASGSVSASISPSNGLQINTNVTATSFTGSFFGTSSWAQNAVTSSYAVTASYLDNYIPPFPYTGSAQITGSLIITGSLNVSQGITGSLLGSSSYALTASYVDLGSIPLIQPVAEYQTLTASISANTPFTLPNGLTYVSSSNYEYIEVFANQSRLSYNIDFIPITTSSIQFTFVVPSGSEMTYKVFRRP